MRYEVCTESPQFFRVKGLTKEILSYLKYSVKPILRYYDEGAWHIHITQVMSLTQLAYSLLGHVDYRVLPESLQIQIADEKKLWSKGSPSRVTTKDLTRLQAYEELYLVPSAPPFVVKAVWKALAKEYHPDKGGDETKFKQFLLAYEKLTE